jgi:hypothetical protein
VLDVDLSVDLLPRHHPLLRALGLLSLRVPTNEWCLVGGLMVLIATRAAGSLAPRAEQTKDGDIVVDVCADSAAVSRLTYELNQLGYDIPPEAWSDDSVARCSFVSGSAQIDVLCPDDAAAEDLDTDAGVRSIAIPGGRRALQMSEMVRIYYSEEATDVELRVPLLAGAIVVKASAVLDGRTTNQPRHAQDLGALLAAVADPRQVRQQLSDDDRKLLSLLSERLADDGYEAWDAVHPDDRRRGQAAARVLVAELGAT